jgi:rubredoxin
LELSTEAIMSKVADKTVADLVGTKKYNTGIQAGDGKMFTDCDEQYYWIDTLALKQKISDISPRSTEQIQRQSSYLSYLQKELDGVVALPGGRAGAMLRAVATEITRPWRVQPDLINTEDPSEAEVPAVVVAHSKDAVMAYMAAHGFDNQDIAQVLSIATSTVKVNLSQFKSNTDEESTFESGTTPLDSVDHRTTKSESDNAQHVCNVCEDEFGTEHGLQTHIGLCHERVSDMKTCPECGKAIVESREQPTDAGVDWDITIIHDYETTQVRGYTMREITDECRLSEYEL